MWIWLDFKAKPTMALNKIWTKLKKRKRYYPVHSEYTIKSQMTNLPT